MSLGDSYGLNFISTCCPKSKEICIWKVLIFKRSILIVTQYRLPAPLTVTELLGWKESRLSDDHREELLLVVSNPFFSLSSIMMLGTLCNFSTESDITSVISVAQIIDYCNWLIPRFRGEILRPLGSKMHISNDGGNWVMESVEWTPDDEDTCLRACKR